MKKLITFTLVSLISCGAAAQTSLIGDLRACAGVKNSLDRLMCYDKVSKRLNGDSKVDYPAPSAAPQAQVSTRTPQPVVAGSPQLQQAQPEQFGLEYKATFDTPDEMRVDIASSKKDVYGKMTITTADGQVWKQMDSRKLKIDTNQSYLITKGAMGAFYLQAVDSGKRIKVKRIK